MTVGTARRRKVKVGRVVSDKSEKTIVVAVERLVRHRLYRRVLRLTTKFAAHDEENEARVGDLVRIEEARPLSRTKRWRLVEVVARAGEGAGEPLVSEEEATSEVIHMAAHPGRERAEAEAEQAESEAAREAAAEAGAQGAGTEAGSGSAAQAVAEAGGAEAEAASGGEPDQEEEPASAADRPSGRRGRST